MYLKTLTLSNFRSFEQTDILLCNDLIPKAVSSDSSGIPDFGGF
jgi:predicted ATP-dependent endonuclease of OLD family